MTKNDRMSDTSNNQRDQIITALKTVRDPELPINIYDLGLIYDLDISDGQAHVRMTLTTPNCPMADVILSQAQKAIESVDGISAATVELIWEPVWDPSRISENAKLELEFMGLVAIFILKSFKVLRFCGENCVHRVYAIEKKAFH